MDIDIACVPNLLICVFQVVFRGEFGVGTFEGQSVATFLEIGKCSNDGLNAVNLAVPDIYADRV